MPRTSGVAEAATRSLSMCMVLQYLGLLGVTNLADLGMTVRVPRDRPGPRLPTLTTRARKTTVENSRPSITVIAPHGTALGPALHAGLVARGWTADLHTVSRADPTHLRTRAVVVIEDDDGNPRM